MYYLIIATIVLLTNLFFLFAYLLQFVLPKPYEVHHLFVASNEVVSSLQALAAAGIGLLTVIYTRHDILSAQYWLVDAYVYCWIGYCIYDLWSMYYAHCLTHDHQLESKPFPLRLRSFLQSSSLNFVLHHVFFGFLILPLWLVLSKGRGHFFCGCLMLDSLSNPCVNLRTVMVKLNLKETKLYRFNFLLMTLCFFVCKILLLPFMFKCYANLHSISMFLAPFKLPKICAFGSVALFGMYFYWFLPMLKGSRKYLNSRSKTE